MDLVEQESLTRFDKRKTNNRKKKKNKGNSTIREANDIKNESKANRTSHESRTREHPVEELNKTNNENTNKSEKTHNRNKDKQIIGNREKHLETRNQAEKKN